MSLAHNLSIAKLGVEYTNKLLSKGSSNKTLDLLGSAFLNGFRVGELREVTSKFTGMGGVPAGSSVELKNLPKIRWMAHTAKKAKVGNCGECASVAFMYLRDIQRAKRLDWMRYNKPGDHAWVVIGRAQKSKTSDYKTWGPEAVVCDPWGNVAFPANQVPSKLPVYSKYSKYGYCSILVTGST